MAKAKKIMNLYLCFLLKFNIIDLFLISYIFTFMSLSLDNRNFDCSYLNIIKAICEKPIANIILNGEKT